MPNKPYSAEEINLLLSKKKIPTRSEKSIQRKLVQLGIRKPKFKVKSHKKRKWTNEEILLLKANKKILNRSKASVRRMQIRLGLVEKNPYRKKWTKKEEKLLKLLLKQKKTLKQVVGEFDRSRDAVQKKIIEMGFSKKVVQEKLSEVELLKLKTFLQNNWQGKTPEELLNLWNAHNRPKIKKNKVLYHLNRLNIKISYGEVVKTKNLHKKEEEIRNRSFKSAKIFDENLRLERAKLMRERMLQGKDIWTGLPALVSIEEEDDVFVH